MIIAFPSVSVTGDFSRDALILAKDLDKLAKHGIRSYRVPLERSVRRVIIPSIRQNFAAEGRPAWRPLAPSTIADRGASGPILDRKGRLKKVATQLNIWKYSRDTATITGMISRVKYAKYHQRGTVKMPARPFILIQDEDKDAIQQIFYEWLDERIRRVGRL